MFEGSGNSSQLLGCIPIAKAKHSLPETSHGDSRGYFPSLQKLPGFVLEFSEYMIPTESKPDWDFSHHVAGRDHQVTAYNSWFPRRKEGPGEF